MRPLTPEGNATADAGILDPVQTRRTRAGWAWFAGGDGLVLPTVPSEASFLGGLGMWVAGMAVVSGFAMTVAASQWWSTSIKNVLWVMPIWAVLYCLIERLVLKSFGTSKSWNLVIALPRLVLSLAIALVVGLPMAQVIYSGSINDELSKTATARIHEATNEITRVYDAKIAAAQKEIAAVQHKEASLQRQVTNSKFLSECEAGEASCSQTHKLGCGPYCKRDARRAAVAAAALRKARPQFEATIAADRRKIALWQTAETTQIAKRVAAIKADRDFLARQAALERVEKANPAVKKYVEFFLVFLIAIDLVALVLKLTHLLSTGGAYERSAAALRATDLVEVHRLQERADVLTRRITLEARAQEEADELRIRGEVTPRQEPEPERPDHRLGRSMWASAAGRPCRTPKPDLPPGAQLDQSKMISGGGPSIGALRSTPVISCTRCRNQTSNASLDSAKPAKAPSMSPVSNRTMTNDPIGVCCSDHSSLVTSSRSCEASNSSRRASVSCANVLASSSLPSKTGKAPRNTAIVVLLRRRLEASIVNDPTPPYMARSNVADRRGCSLTPTRALARRRLPSTWLPHGGLDRSAAGGDYMAVTIS